MYGKAIAERQRVEAETETMFVRTKLAEQEAQGEVVKIERVGAAFQKYPNYTLVEVHRAAGQRGNLVLAGPNPIQLQLPAMTTPTTN